MSVDPHELSSYAKEEALSKWVEEKRGTGSLEACLATPELPRSLHGAVCRAWAAPRRKLWG